MDFAAQWSKLRTQKPPSHKNSSSSTTTTSTRQRELEDWHQHQKSLQRRSSTTNPTSGIHQQQLYQQHYGNSGTTTSSNPNRTATATHSATTPPPSAPAATTSATTSATNTTKPSVVERVHRKAQLREYYEYKMHKDRTNREFFAVTMNNNQPGQILRSGVLSVLPTNSGPKKIHPDDYSRDPALAGGRSTAALQTKGDTSVHYRPHEKQVSPGYKPGYAGQSSEKLSYHVKCGTSKRSYSPEAHHRTHRHSLRKNNEQAAHFPKNNFPWHSPDAQLIKNQQLKAVPGPERDHVHDIIAPHKYNEFEALFEPTIKHEAEAVIDWHKERRTGKKCDRIAHIERVHPIDTAERVFPTHRTFKMSEHHHGRKHVLHQGDHVKEQQLF